MSEWQKACDVSALRPGEPRATELSGEQIGIFFDGRKCFALENICTHAYALMTDGFWEGEVVECPLHGATFEVRTGRCTGLPAIRDLKTYETRIADGSVYVRMGGKAAEGDGESRAEPGGTP